MKIWTEGPPPENLSGVLVLVVLKRAEDKWHTLDGREYYGDPVAVNWYGHKGKTTYDPVRINPEEIIKYCIIEPL